MEKKEGDTYKYGAYFSRTQTSYTSTAENGQNLECYRNKPMGEKCINSDFVEIKNPTVTLINVLSTNQAPSQVEIAKM